MSINSQCICSGLWLLAVVGCGVKEPPKAHFVHQVDWLGHGQWLKADLHSHTTFSDGSHTIAEVVDKAASFHCDVVAITDHASHNLLAATPPYFKEIEAARNAHPELILLAGLEWNVPPWGGDEHANVFLASLRDEAHLLALFKADFDDFERAEHRTELADQALRWLAEHGAEDGLSPVVLYNHPCRKRNVSTDIVAELAHMRQINSLVVGMEGGPGHQRSRPLAGYKSKQQLIDRWDPVVARVGDAWDQLLNEGIDVWGAESSSDFHNAHPDDRYDYWPGEFSETWLYVPEKNRRGVLRALQAGTFFGVQGHIARNVQIVVDADGLPRPAQAGETIATPAASELRVEVNCNTPETDWEGKPNRLDTIELITIDESGAKVILTHPVTKESPSLQTALKPLGKGVVLRARGRRIIPGGPDLMFYTNPVRVVLK